MRFSVPQLSHSDLPDDFFFPGSLAMPKLLELPREFRDYLKIYTLEMYMFAVTLTLK